MREFGDKRATTWNHGEQGPAEGVAPGKRTLVEMLPQQASAPAMPASASAPVQRKQEVTAPVPAPPSGPRPTIQELFGRVPRKAEAAEPDTATGHASSQRGIATSASSLPHAEAISATPGEQTRTVSSGGGGTAMPTDVRRKMEAAFGADFSSVRIVEGAHVAAAGAQAYTQGTDIHFAPGQYQPASERGQQLLGHELTHVVQKAQGRVRATAQFKGLGINADPGLEREADDHGARAARGEAVGASAASQLDTSKARGTDAAVQRKESDAKAYVLQHMTTFARYGVRTSEGNWLILLLKQLWDASDPEFTVVFTELIKGLNIRPGQATDGYDPATLWEVYSELAEVIGKQHAINLFAKHEALFFTSKQLLAHFTPSGDVEFPYVKTLYKKGPRWDGRGADEQAIGVLAMVPTHPGGKRPDDIVATYKTGFSKKEAARRLGMSIGINAFAGIGSDPEVARDTVTELGAATKDDSIPLSLVKFTWKRHWRGSTGPVSNEFLLAVSSFMPESERLAFQQEEKKPVPHGLIREAILKADSTARVKDNLAERPFIADVYYHIADDDAASVRTPQGSGVYTEYQKELRKRKTETGESPTLLAGGYRVRREDNEDDKGDIPATEGGTELAEIASDLDHALRDAIAELEPRIPYLSEANMLVKASALDAKVKSDDDPDNLTGGIFGKTNFESGNLKRFMGLNDLDTETAKTQMGYVYDASLVTGTKGGGARFYDYRFKKPENYLAAMERPKDEDGHVSWEDTKSSAYKNAISTSQNIGSLGNLAINLSLYFSHVKHWTVSSGTICKIIADTVGQAELDTGLRKALLDEAGFKKASTSTGDNFSQHDAQAICSLVVQTVQIALPIHERAYEQVTRLLYDYIQAHAKKRKQTA